MKKTLLAAALTAVFVMTSASALAAEDIVYESKAEGFSSGASVQMASGVTSEMCDASYWKALSIGKAGDELMSRSEIDVFNKKTQDASGTGTSDISSTFAEVYNADSNRSSLGSTEPFAYRTDKSSFYVNGVTVDKSEYTKEVLAAIRETGYTGTSKETEYAVGVHRTKMLAMPVPYDMGWSASDPDDENCIAIVDVNEPLVIRQKAEFEGHTFYYCGSDNCSGWVDGMDIAICRDKAEWLDAWKVNSAGKDFIVVTQDKIVLEKSHMGSDSSELKLTIGTILKLVPEEQIPETVDERGTWNNYVVYIPVRREDGTYRKGMALISQHLSVSEGFLPYTQENTMKLAFACLGNRYGWGGCDDAMDCTLYTRLVYKCMGFQMPRNTTGQCNVTAGNLNISSMSEEEKGKLLETTPVGALLYFPGHAVIYTGTSDGTGYCISDTGTLQDSIIPGVKTMYSVILNPLTVRRGNGSTWLANTTNLILPAGSMDISKAEVTYTDDVTVTYMGKTLYEGINFTLSKDEEKAEVTGINNFSGIVTAEKVKVTEPEPEPEPEPQPETKKISITGKKAVLSYTTAIYTGSAKKPAVTISGLTKDKDYTVTYSGNTKVGKAVCTVKGKGKYTGTKTLSFTIRPSKASIRTLTAKKTSMTVKAAKKVSATGGSYYEISYRVKGSSRWKTVKTRSQSKTIKSLKKKKTYQVKVRSYRVVNGKRYNGDWSSVKSIKLKK